MHGHFDEPSFNRQFCEDKKHRRSPAYASAMVEKETDLNGFSANRASRRVGSYNTLDFALKMIWWRKGFA